MSHAGYAQMTKEQERRWGEDVNEFVVEEDEEVFSVRSSACLLVEELVTAFPEAASAALNSAIARLFRETADLKVGPLTKSHVACEDEGGFGGGGGGARRGGREEIDVCAALPGDSSPQGQATAPSPSAGEGIASI